MQTAFAEYTLLTPMVMIEGVQHKSIRLWRIAMSSKVSRFIQLASP